MTLSTKHYLWFINILILGLVVWSTVNLGMTVLDHTLEDRLIGRDPVQAQGSATPRLKSLTQYEAISRNNIFGGTSEEIGQTTAAETSDNVPTQVSVDNMRLKGTIVDPESGYSLAILENINSREQDLYRPGDDVGQSKVVRVELDSVTLKQGANETKLMVSQEDIKDQPTRSSQRNRPDQSMGSSGGGDDAIAKSMGDNRFVVSRSTLGKHMGDLNYFMSNVLIKPYFKDGQAHGFKVASVRTGSPVYELGFRPGDVILKVNDISVNKPEDLVNLYRQVQQLENVDVEVERRGKQETLNYTFR